MRSARLLVCIVAIAGGVAAGSVLVPRALHGLRALTFPTLTAPGAHANGTRGGTNHRAGHHPSPNRMSVASQAAPRARQTPAATHRDDSSFALLTKVGKLIVLGLALLVVGSLLLAARRARRRLTRSYALYQLHLSTHDQAKGQDLEDMVEQIANIVRAWPAQRARNGQPYFALELICGTEESETGGEMEWSINVRCEPGSVSALDGAISATYPDVRLGRVHADQPHPRAAMLREPGYVMRFRKERSFVYSLIADVEREASSPLEQIARAQIAQDAASVVRFQLTPTPSSFEELARRLYRRHENKLIRQERWGLPEGGLTSTFNRAEMRAAEGTQNRSLFWFETVVAADSPEVCKAIGAAVQSRRGENRLHRRWMVVRQRLYRRRFPPALGPILPSFRCLVSAAEVAHLLELPSARMKGVPVRRVTIPRIPAPPEVGHGRLPREPVDPPGDGTARQLPQSSTPPRPDGDPHMSQRDYPHRDAAPDIPRLPEPPTIARASRTRQVPSSGTMHAAADARARLPGGSPSSGVRPAEDTSRRPR
jgi:hypothetical protein